MHTDRLRFFKKDSTEKSIKRQVISEKKGEGRASPSAPSRSNHNVYLGKRNARLNEIDACLFILAQLRKQPLLAAWDVSPRESLLAKRPTRRGARSEEKRLFWQAS